MAELTRPADVSAEPEISGRSDEEATFARDDNDRLIVREAATREQFSRLVSITIDGMEVVVPEATPRTDALGNVRLGDDGQPIPRATTIFDAATKLVADRIKKGELPEGELARRIPVLCHQPHLDPIAVCRVCSVHISKIEKGKPKPGRKLVPACQHRVEPNMVVTTSCGTGRDADLVRESLQALTDLLCVDHLHSDPARETLYRNELGALKSQLNVTLSRYSAGPTGGDRNRVLHPRSRPREEVGSGSVAISLREMDCGSSQKLQTISRSEMATLPTPHSPLPTPQHPYSSRTVHVDHDRCILCDRCVRSCSDVKPFKVIGHTGKGYRTRISFDLDQIMEESSCVQCGECMTACPTGALTLNRRVAPINSWADRPKISKNPLKPLPPGFLSADEMGSEAVGYIDKNGTRRVFYPFKGIPYPYLRWNEGAVRRRAVREGETLCKQGDHGSTAFMLLTGTFQGQVRPPAVERPGLLGRLFGKRGAPDSSAEIRFDIRAGDDLILGELACLNAAQRTATLVATSAGSVLEVTRNLLSMMLRNPEARGVLEDIIRHRGIRSSLEAAPMFKDLDAGERKKLLDEFTPISELYRVEPGQVILGEGDEVGAFYIIRQGFVRISVKDGPTERVLAYLKRKDHFGEIALMGDHNEVNPLLPNPSRPFQRTATCTALDDVELVKVPGNSFREICKSYPEIREKLAKVCAERLRQRERDQPVEEEGQLREFLRQGLFQGQKMLVLDLESCTRCDECTRACADSHGDGHSRLMREGLRFGQFLVAASCRSCHQPYCMDGCPVDAIHRSEKSLEILIADHCIGCSLCERNCPYGSIQMVPRTDREAGPPGLVAQAAGRRAVNCDLCNGLVPSGAETFCVSACPHEAAFRWSGEELLSEVKARS